MAKPAGVSHTTTVLAKHGRVGTSRWNTYGHRPVNKKRKTSTGTFAVFWSRKLSVAPRVHHVTKARAYCISHAPRYELFIFYFIFKILSLSPHMPGGQPVKLQAGSFEVPPSIPPSDEVLVAMWWTDDASNPRSASPSDEPQYVLVTESHHLNWLGSRVAGIRGRGGGVRRVRYDGHRGLRPY